METRHTRYNTPPYKLDGAGSIWSTFEKDEDGNAVIVLRTRNVSAAKTAAAAPELLSALENAVDIMRFHCHVNHDKTGDYMGMLAQCDAAITKAKGA